MKPEKRYINTQFEIRELEEEGTFTGYASTFGNKFPIWMGLHETVRRGAFANTLLENGGQVPILHNHESREQIGWNEKGTEDRKGLLVEGWLDIENNARARSQWALMKKAEEMKFAKLGLSIGFEVLDEEVKKKKDEPDLRVIKEINLFEFSVTPFPANPKAGVTGVRNISDLIGSLDQLSSEERTLLLAELRQYEAVPLEAPSHWTHVVLESLREANIKIRGENHV